jgi:hypothetical protein
VNKFFLILCLQRLPGKLRVLLGDDEEADSRNLAAKADQLRAMHAHVQVGSVAAVGGGRRSCPSGSYLAEPVGKIWQQGKESARAFQ